MRITCQNEGFHLYFVVHRTHNDQRGVALDMSYLFYTTCIPGVRTGKTTVVARIAKMYGGEHRYRPGVAVTYDVYTTTIRGMALRYAFDTERYARSYALDSALSALKDPHLRAHFEDIAYPRVMHNRILTPACVDRPPWL